MGTTIKSISEAVSADSIGYASYIILGVQLLITIVLFVVLFFISKKIWDNFTKEQEEIENETLINENLPLMQSLTEHSMENLKTKENDL